MTEAATHEKRNQPMQQELLRQMQVKSSTDTVHSPDDTLGASPGDNPGDLPLEPCAHVKVLGDIPDDRTPQRRWQGQLRSSELGSGDLMLIKSVQNALCEILSRFQLAWLCLGVPVVH